jgi:hypothetical protein
MPCCGSRPPKADETIVAADTRTSSLGLVDHVGCGVQPQPILTQQQQWQQPQWPRPSATTTAMGAPPPPAGMDERATAAGRKGTGSRGRDHKGRGRQQVQGPPPRQARLRSRDVAMMACRTTATATTNTLTGAAVAPSIHPSNRATRQDDRAMSQARSQSRAEPGLGNRAATKGAGASSEAEPEPVAPPLLDQACKGNASAGCAAEAARAKVIDIVFDDMCAADEPPTPPALTHTVHDESGKATNNADTETESEMECSPGCATVTTAGYSRWGGAAAQQGAAPATRGSMALAELSSESESETETETETEEEADDDAASLTRHLCQADNSEEEELEVFSVLPRESRSKPQRLCPAPMPSRLGAAAAVTQPPRQEELVPTQPPTPPQPPQQAAATAAPKQMAALDSQRLADTCAFDMATQLISETGGDEGEEGSGVRTAGGAVASVQWPSPGEQKRQRPASSSAAWAAAYLGNEVTDAWQRTTSMEDFVQMEEAATASQITPRPTTTTTTTTPTTKTGARAASLMQRPPTRAKAVRQIRDLERGLRKAAAELDKENTARSGFVVASSHGQHKPPPPAAAAGGGGAAAAAAGAGSCGGPLFPTLSKLQESSSSSFMALGDIQPTSSTAMALAASPLAPRALVGAVASGALKSGLPVARCQRRAGATSAINQLGVPPRDLDDSP